MLMLIFDLIQGAPWYICASFSQDGFQDKCFWEVQFSSVHFSRSVVSNSLRHHESQHTRPPSPSPSPKVHSDSRPLRPWCHPAVSSSVVPFSSCPQSLPASESFPMSQLFAWGGQSTGVSALASFLPKKSQGWSPSARTGWISLQSKGLSRIFSNTAVQKHQFFGAQPSLQSNSHVHTCDRTAKRSYPTSEVRGSGLECQAAMAQKQLRGTTPRWRSWVTVERSYLVSEARDCGWKELPHVRGQGQRPRPGSSTERSNPTSEGRWLCVYHSSIVTVCGVINRPNACVMILIEKLLFLFTDVSFILLLIHVSDIYLSWRYCWFQI